MTTELKELIDAAKRVLEMPAACTRDAEIIENVARRAKLTQAIIAVEAAVTVLPSA